MDPPAHTPREPRWRLGWARNRQASRRPPAAVAPPTRAPASANPEGTGGGRTKGCPGQRWRPQPRREGRSGGGGGGGASQAGSRAPLMRLLACSQRHAVQQIKQTSAWLPARLCRVHQRPACVTWSSNLVEQVDSMATGCASERLSRTVCDGSSMGASMGHRSMGLDRPKTSDARKNEIIDARFRQLLSTNFRVLWGFGRKGSNSRRLEAAAHMRRPTSRSFASNGKCRGTAAVAEQFRWAAPRRTGRRRAPPAGLVAGRGWGWAGRGRDGGETLALTPCTRT